MNILNRENIDWETLTAQLLWHNIVYHKNEYSGYDIITNDIPSWCKDKPEEACQRGYKPGDIIPDVRIFSYWIGPTRQLTWKELALALGFWKENLLPDHHDCKICEQRKKCKAYFKDKEDQEKCSGWMEEHGYDDEKEYKIFIDNLLNTKYKNLEIINLNEDELKSLQDYMDEETFKELQNIMKDAKISKES